MVTMSSARASQARLLCSLGVICCSLISLAVGTSYNYGFDVTRSLKDKRQAGGFIVTTGMPLNQDGSVPTRLEIRTLQQDPDRWALYILALDMLQYTNQLDPSSWYAITGTLHVD